jgi:DNA-binding MarR family transcriptional regulator
MSGSAADVPGVPGVPGVSESAADAAREVRVVVSRLRRRLAEVYDNNELTPSQTSVLSRLGKEGPASASDIAAAERVRPQSIAATLAALDERGLIERDQDPDDGRRQLISLSADGLELFRNRQRRGREWLDREMQARYTEAERLTLIEAMALLDRLTR